METSIVVLIILIIMLFITIYISGDKNGFKRGYDKGYKKATDEYEKVIEENTKFLDEIENRWKRDYYR